MPDAVTKAQVRSRVLSVKPDLLGMHRANPQRYPFLLESAALGTEQGRFSFLFGFPGQEVCLKAGASPSDFLAELDERWRQESLPASSSPLPFQGGWFFYLSYEMAGAIERTLSLPQEEEQPLAWAVRIPAAVIIDHQDDVAYLVAEADHPQLLDELERDAESIPPSRESGPLLSGGLVEEDPSQYIAAVNRTRQYIVDGDVFQANLSRAWKGEISPGVTPADIYQSLRRTNPGPFAGLAVRGQHAIISSSPERLVSHRGGRVDTRPIAGTRPRGQAVGQDADLLRELIGHPKERAEHIMLIDLERNDLGRICTPGSVEVNELMVVESYAHVHHIVSNVRGRVRSNCSPGDILKAVFPGGTITGCPKVRCMEIIGELEGRPRGAYTGSFGYLNRDGSMDSNILIRTMESHGNEIRFLAGAGIVADSDPERELEETRAKARGMLLALEA